MSVVNYMLQLLYPREEPQYPLARRLVGPQIYSGHFGEQENLLLLLGLEPWAIQPID